MTEGSGPSESSGRTGRWRPLLAGVAVGATVGWVVENEFVGVLVATFVGFPVAALAAARYGRRAGSSVATGTTTSIRAG